MKLFTWYQIGVNSGNKQTGSKWDKNKSAQEIFWNFSNVFIKVPLICLLLCWLISCLLHYALSSRSEKLVFFSLISCWVENTSSIHSFIHYPICDEIESLVHMLLYIFQMCTLTCMYVKCTSTCLCVNIRAGSSCGRWVRCWSLRKLPPLPAASGSGWLHEAADRAASGRMCHLLTRPGWRGLGGADDGVWGVGEEERGRKGQREKKMKKREWRVRACGWYLK